MFIVFFSWMSFYNLLNICTHDHPARTVRHLHNGLSLANLNALKKDKDKDKGGILKAGISSRQLKTTLESLPTLSRIGLPVILAATG